MLDEASLLTIIDEIAGGKSLRQICREKDLAESSVRRWIAASEQVLAHSARARELGCDALADECLEIADKPSKDAVEAADKRIKIDTRLRLIGKWSQRYSDKLTVNNNTTVTHKHDLGSLSTAELEQLETILAKSERGAGDTGATVAPSVH
jgi:hypothetical protein